MGYTGNQSHKRIENCRLETQNEIEKHVGIVLHIEVLNEAIVIDEIIQDL